MKWEKVKLADICEVITKGTTPSNIGAEFIGEGIKYIRSEMLTSSKYIADEGFLYIFWSYLKPLQNLITK